MATITRNGVEFNDDAQPGLFVRTASATSQADQDTEIAKHAEYTPGKVVTLTDTPADAKEIAKLADGNYVIANAAGDGFDPLTPAAADKRGWYAVYPTTADLEANANEVTGATFPITETLTAVAAVALDTGYLYRPLIANPAAQADWARIGGATAAVLTDAQVVVETDTTTVGEITPKVLETATMHNEDGLRFEFADLAARDAETGYTVTARDIAKKRLFKVAGSPEIYIPTGTPGAVAWELVGGAPITFADQPETEAGTVADKPVAPDQLAAEITRRLGTLFARLGITFDAADWGTGFTGDTISDNATTLLQVLQELETKVEAAELLGDKLGSAATYAALPATTAANANDWAVLTADEIGTGTADAPQYPKGIYDTDGTTWSLFQSLRDPLDLTNAEMIEKAGDASYDAGKTGLMSVAGLDAWGVSRRMRRIFNVTTSVDLTTDPVLSTYPNRTAVFLRNTDSANGISITHGKTNVVGVYANSTDIAGNPAAINVQPGEIACWEIDGDTIYISIFPAERVLAFDNYTQANAFGPMPHDGIVTIRTTGEAFARLTGTNAVSFPADGQPNADWFKLGGIARSEVWAASTAYAENSKVVAIAPDGVFSGKPRIYQANSIRPDTVTAFDATEAAEWTDVGGAPLVDDTFVYQYGDGTSFSVDALNTAAYVPTILESIDGLVGNTVNVSVNTSFAKTVTLDGVAVTPSGGPTTTVPVTGVRTVMVIRTYTDPSAINGQTRIITIGGDAREPDFAADMLDIANGDHGFTFDAGNSDTTPTNTEKVIGGLGIRPVQANFTAAAQKHDWLITKDGTVNVYIPKHSTTPITIQLLDGSDTFAIDLALDGTLTQNATDTTELTGVVYPSKALDNDEWWMVPLSGTRPQNVTLRLWGNDIGDPGDFTDIQYAFEIVSPVGSETTESRREIAVTNAAIRNDAWAVQQLGFNPTTANGRLILESDIGEIEIELPMLASKQYHSGVTSNAPTHNLRALYQSGNTISVASSTAATHGTSTTTLRRIWYYESVGSTVIENATLLFQGSTTNVTSESVTFPSGATLQQVCEQYDELLVSYHESSLRNQFKSRRIRTADFIADKNGGTNFPAWGEEEWYNSSTYGQGFPATNENATTWTFAGVSGARNHRNLRLYGIKSLAVDPGTVVVPAPDITLSATGGLNTINGNATQVVAQGIPTIIQLDCGTGQQLDMATPPTIDSGTLRVVDPTSGLVEVLTDAASSAITFAVKASAFATVENLIGEYVPPGVTSDQSGPFPLATGTRILGFDLTQCDRLEFELGSNSTGFRRQWFSAGVKYDSGNSEMQLTFVSATTVQYLNLDVTDAATGTVNFNAASGTIYLCRVRGYSTRPTAHVVPAGTVASNVVTVTANSAATTGEVREGQWAEVQATVTAGQMVDLSQAITVDVAGATAVCSHREGVFRVLIPVGGGNADITFSETPLPTSDTTRATRATDLVLTATTSGWETLPDFTHTIDRTGKARFVAGLSGSRYGSGPRTSFRLVYDLGGPDELILDMRKIYSNQTNHYVMVPLHLESLPIDVTIGKTVVLQHNSAGNTINRLFNSSDAQSWHDYERLT